jgi:heme-degrading monooxygenase HmoA
VEGAAVRFRELVLPTLRQQPGYEGAVALTTPAGQGLLMSFWADEEAATDGVRSGFYAEQVQKFMTFFKSPPGRETYDVVFAETPADTFA